MTQLVFFTYSCECQNLLMEPWTKPRTLLLGMGITSSATMTNSMIVNIVMSVHTGSKVFPGPIVLLLCFVLIAR
ncbi:hypothetical protein COO60DRAFT_1568795 [Scenedesmus sp. NREL 46B-D3]|nr:hypothetical protein COO60DRAFT_1568795 [Scenedesmus sp. NREL 46B-D3]